MPTKKGAGGKPQEFNKDNGRFVSENWQQSSESNHEFRQNASYSSIIESDKGASGTQVEFRTPTHKEFRNLLVDAKSNHPSETRWRVDVHDEADYLHDTLFVTKGGSTVAVETDGNIISVCKHPKENIRGSELLKKAVENGGDRLDAFGEDLYTFYTKNGFEPVSYTPFNMKYAPEGWRQGIDKLEPVIFYKYTGRKIALSYEDFISNTMPSTDYDTAKSIRDKEITK